MSFTGSSEHHHAPTAGALLSCLDGAFARTRARGWLAAPGGLILDLPGRLLPEEFGARHVMRYEDLDFPPALVHEPTRHFLRERGLPEDDSSPFRLDTELPLPTLREYDDGRGEGRSEGDGHEFAEGGAVSGALLPATADTLVRLGRVETPHGVRRPQLAQEATDILVEGSTGALFGWQPGTGRFGALHGDVSTLAFALWLRRLETDSAVA